MKVRRFDQGGPEPCVERPGGRFVLLDDLDPFLGAVNALGETYWESSRNCDLGCCFEPKLSQLMAVTQGLREGRPIPPPGGRQATLEEHLRYAEEIGANFLGRPGPKETACVLGREVERLRSATIRERDLAMLTKQLVRALRQVSPGHPAAARAHEYLVRHGLLGSVLRDDGADGSEDVEYTKEG